MPPSDPNPVLLARRIAAIIERTRIDVSTEGAAHRSVAKALRDDGMTVATEVCLSARDRIDLMVGTVGIEVKVQGGRRGIHGQLARYAAHDAVRALVIATGAAWPVTVMEIGGKPVVLASLSRGWL